MTALPERDLQEPAAGALPSRPVVGILLIHGIGEQPRGDTLVRFGEPIVHWIKRWIGPAGNVAFTRASLEHEANARFEEPAHFLVSIDRGTLSASVSDRATALRAVSKWGAAPGASGSDAERGDPTPGAEGRGGREGAEEWIVAESWWAPHIRRPLFGPFARWLLSRGPWVILSHFGGKLREEVGWRKVLALLKCLVAVPGALLAQIVVAVVAVLAVIPWPRLREALSALLLKLTGTLGDSYVLIESPVQRTSAVTQTRRDLNWLVARCRTVVVVAHSQGTAIAREAVQGSGSNVAALLTFGQGLKKLEELRHLTENWNWFFSLTSFSLPATALVVWMSFYPPPDLQLSDNLGTARYFLIGYPSFLLVQVILGAITGSAYRAGLDALKPGDKLRWVDFYSRADPVPGGALDRYVAGVDSREVHNLSSVTKDHTAYLDNRDQFVGPLVVEIDRAAGTRLFRQEDVEFIERIAAGRPRRVRVLALIRWASMVSVPLVAYGLRHELRVIGRVVLDPLLDVPLVGTVGRLLQEIGRTSEQAVSFLLPVSSTGSPDGMAFAAIALLALIVFGWYALAERLWHTWDNLAVQPLFKSTSPGERNQQRLVAVFVALLGLVPLSVAVATLFGFEVQDVRLFLWNAVWLAPMLPFVILLLLLPPALLWVIGQLGVAGYRQLRQWVNATWR